MRGKRRSKAWSHPAAQLILMAGEQAARAIEATDAGPGRDCIDPSCPDFDRHEQKRRDAATVRRVTKAIAEGRYPAWEPQPACPAAIAEAAALARMEAVGR